MRYSLRLILVSSEAVGAKNVKPAADIELAQMDLPEGDTRLSLERLAKAAQSGLKALMEE